MGLRSRPRCAPPDDCAGAVSPRGLPPGAWGLPRRRTGGAAPGLHPSEMNETVQKSTGKRPGRARRRSGTSRGRKGRKGLGPRSGRRRGRQPIGPRQLRPGDERAEVARHGAGLFEGERPPELRHDRASAFDDRPGQGVVGARPLPVRVGEIRNAGDVPNTPAVDAVAPDAVSRVERRDGLPLLLRAAHPEPGPLTNDRRGARGTRGDAPGMAVALLEPGKRRVRRANRSTPGYECSQGAAAHQGKDEAELRSTARSHGTPERTSMRMMLKRCRSVSWRVGRLGADSVKRRGWAIRGDSTIGVDELGRACSREERRSGGARDDEPGTLVTGITSLVVCQCGGEIRFFLESAGPVLRIPRPGPSRPGR
jgi:hypothetical protein